MTKGFLIAGGVTHEGRQKVEIYIPASNKTCGLQNLPDTYRFGVSMCGGLLCGGVIGMPSGDYCLKWEPERGTFSGTPVERSIGINFFSCWDLGDRGVLIMGYNDLLEGGDDRITDQVAADGLTSSSSFTLKHKIR